MNNVTVTHLFLGDDTTFLSRKFMRSIVENSALSHRFVVFTAADSFSDWKNFIEGLGLVETEYLLIRSGARGILRGFHDLLKICLFASRKVLSHRRHYNLALPILLLVMGKRLSFMCWGDVPARKHGVRRLIQLVQFALYKVGLVQISSEIPLFHKQCYSRLKMLTVPYLRNNDQVMRYFEVDSNSKSEERILLIGNNSWYFELYGEVLDGLDWRQWDKVVCMLNYGNASKQKAIDDFCTCYEAKYGEKVFMWRKAVPFDEYLAVLKSCRMYIFPAMTQGGIDLTYNMLLLGKIVVCRGVNYAWLKSVGCFVRNLDEMQLDDIGENCVLSCDEVRNNQIIVCNLTDKNVKNIAHWDRVYSDCL